MRSGDFAFRRFREALRFRSGLALATTLLVLEYVIGIPTKASLADVAVAVENIVGVPFHARESSYWGDPYYSSPLSSHFKFRLTENLDPMYLPRDPREDEWFFSEAPECRVLLWATDADIAALDLVRRMNETLDVECRLLKGQ